MGIGFAYLQAANVMTESAVKLRDLCTQYYQFHIKTRPPNLGIDESQYLLGHMGVYVIQALNPSCQNQDQMINRINQLVDVVLPVDYQRHGGDEMLVGRTGFLAGILMLRMRMRHDILPIARIKLIIDAMLQSGRQYSAKNTSPCPLMYRYHGTEYLGSSHVLCAILQMLLSFPECLDEKALDEIHRCVDWMVGIQTSTGNWPTTVDEVGGDRGEDDLIHWCHGAPGVIYLMAMAYLKWKDEKYLKACERASALIWQRGLLLKGPGICHGVAGNGYAFLLMYRLTGKMDYLNMAKCFAIVMCSPEFEEKARTPDAPYSLFEGVAGAVCFLADLMEPNKAQFPMVPVALLP